MVKLVNGVGVKDTQHRINNMEMINMFTSDSVILFAVDFVIFYLLLLFFHIINDWIDDIQ